MGKYGKKKSISLNPLDYNITILGEGGIGKTTLAKEMCEKLVGDEGYIHFDIGNEAGADAIEGIISEPIPDWEKLADVTDDIIENKDSDYPDLKVVIWDTLDELIPIVEDETIRLWNKKTEKKVSTINEAWGGFQKGQAHAIQMLVDKMADLRRVGVSSIVIAHVKKSDITDPVTQETYSKLTADTTQKYFNAIKNKQHFVALAYIDREIVKEKTGRKNVVTKEEITINKVVSESRVISFRDDTYSVDSKSRFADIVDHIPFSVDEFIKAMTDAINKEKTKNGKTLKEAEKEQAKRDKEKAKKASENSKNAKENKVDIDKNEDLVKEITEKFSEYRKDEDKKDNIVKFKALIKDSGVGAIEEIAELPTVKVEEMLAVLTA